MLSNSRQREVRNEMEDHSSPLKRNSPRTSGQVARSRLTQQYSARDLPVYGEDYIPKFLAATKRVIQSSDEDGMESGAESEASRADEGDDDEEEEEKEVERRQNDEENQIICPNSQLSQPEESDSEDPLLRFRNNSMKRSNSQDDFSGKKKTLEQSWKRRAAIHIPSSDAAHEADLYSTNRHRADRNRDRNRNNADGGVRRYNLRSRDGRLKISKDIVAIKQGNRIVHSPVYKLRSRERHVIPVKSANGMVQWSSLDLQEESTSYNASSDSESDSQSNSPLRNKKKRTNIVPSVVKEDIGFDQIAGVDNFLVQLKEMIILPLVYPDLFKRLGIVPPRGVLFHGPPGTGKTLLARILASTSSKMAGKDVSFFHRNGSECLSKWIGEAEQNLVKLFKQAKEQAPSIIFFDEVDGMAPDRSGGGRAQDQSHISLVSMLLSLMDGLEDRGAVVVIGATNRIDAVDPALRRPGRFDKEFYFQLPDLQARRSILQICAKDVQPWLLEKLAKETEGYSGAELKGLCTEASLVALRRSFPSLYTDVLEERPAIAPTSAALLTIGEEDFRRAFNPKRNVNCFSSMVQGLPKALSRLMEANLRQLVRDIERLTLKDGSSVTWRNGEEQLIRLPIASLDFNQSTENPEDDNGSDLTRLDLIKMKRKFLISLALRLVPSPSSIVVMDPAVLLLGPQSPDAILLTKFRPVMLNDRVLVVHDLERLFALVSDDVFALWLEEWSMSESSRLLILHPPNQPELLQGVVFQRLGLSFSLISQAERKKFIDYCLRKDDATAASDGKDLADILGVVVSSPLASELDIGGAAETEEDLEGPVETDLPEPTPSWLNSFPRACALYHRRTDDQLTW